MNKNKLEITTECLEDLLQISKYGISITGVEYDPIKSSIIFTTEGSGHTSEFITLIYTVGLTNQLTEVRSGK